MHTGISFVDNFGNWPFMQEPIYRWLMFFLAIAGISWAWRGALDFMH